MPSYGVVVICRCLTRRGAIRRVRRLRSHDPASRYYVTKRSRWEPRRYLICKATLKKS